ncbi:hypothetical protein SD77_2140 [Bacillus badius]|uniref:Uncharacterized protein n=1 Tax=Bacillus badius TaxID=1455 RepID=A0ABR5AY72_BACBA|nr:hypothetical protein SD78_2394 [Bacillus badius]KIL79686.1 hypothetical protein SD77_2140 [Bacillus badius]
MTNTCFLLLASCQVILLEKPLLQEGSVWSAVLLLAAADLPACFLPFVVAFPF